MAQSQVKTLAASAARTATGSGGGVSVPGSHGVAFLNVSAQSGTTPTLDVDVQSLDPVSGSWVTISSFSQVGAATGAQRLAFASLPDTVVRANWTITGGTPSYTFSVSFISAES